jgi:hypothetical protein
MFRLGACRVAMVIDFDLIPGLPDDQQKGKLRSEYHQW